MRVLIIDDESLIRKCLYRIALSRGHTVKAEKDGIAGLNTWQSFQPHLVFLDVLLPFLDGPSLLKKSGKKNHEKIVMMSAHQSFTDKSFSNIDLFVKKPFDMIKTFQSAEDLVLRSKEPTATV